MMERITLQIILFLWFGCLCKLTEGSCHHDPIPCTYHYECPKGHKCLGGGCRRCYCEDMRQCSFNHTTNRKFCDCDITNLGTFGPYCECKRGCHCPEHYADVVSCDRYCRDFDAVLHKNLICSHPEDELAVRTPNLQSCKARCNNFGCNFIVWKADANPICRMYKLTDFGTNLCSVEYAQNYQTLTRKCRCNSGRHHHIG